MSKQQPIVVLTREKHHLGTLTEELEMLGYRPFHVPTLITEPLDNAGITLVFSRLQEFTDMLFVSRNAVKYGMRALQELQLSIPSELRVLAVGAETAKHLKQHHIDALCPTKGSGVEALLARDQLVQLKDRKLLIVRGTHGLNWPIDEFRNRGAEVEQINIYTQSKPMEGQALIEKVIIEPIDGVFLHSAQSAANFMQAVEPHLERLNATLLVAGSQRIAGRLLDLGWGGRIEVADSPSNKHMLLAFCGQLGLKP